METQTTQNKWKVGFLASLALIFALSVFSLVAYDRLRSLQEENDFLRFSLDMAELDAEALAMEDNFQFYYASKVKQRYGVDELEECLDRWKWSEDAYVEGVFDCSEMSAYIEWKLENEGFNTCIICGDAPSGGEHHAWLLVETSEGKYMPVEATEYDIVLWSDPYFDNYFEYDYDFETIQEALDYDYNEFDWWNS